MMRKGKGKITMELTYNKSSSRYKVSGTGEGKRHTTEGVGVRERVKGIIQMERDGNLITHRQTNSQTNRKTDKQTDSQTDSQTGCCSPEPAHVPVVYND